MSAIYNEIDPFACGWLRNLEAAGHIAPGRVLENDIRSLRADTIDSEQAHFFAGIGVWSHALRLAGWPDDMPVWTGSCPCQPFSVSGRKGGFDDERHLWPVWFGLIAEHRPPVVLGEQVASPAGLEWLDLVQADLAGEGYTFGAAILPAAGVGAPHLRERLWFAAVAEESGRIPWRWAGEARDAWLRAEQLGRRGAARELGDTDGERREGLEVHVRERGPRAGVPETLGTGGSGELGDSARWSPGRVPEGAQAGQPEPGDARVVGDAGLDGDRKHAGELPRDEGEHEEREAHGDHAPVAAGSINYPESLYAGPVGGFWADAEWLPCLDGKSRAVEPGTFPLVDGAPSRVGRLRAYGNAITGPEAAVWIACVMDFLTDRGTE